MATESREDADRKQRSKAMERLIWVVAIGCFIILVYGFRAAHGGASVVVGVVSVGLMAGGAALLSGGLLGFLFGVPHTRVAEGGQTTEETSDNGSEQQGKLETRRPSTSYLPNTGLEQISDWLTKMLVGVGLIEIKIIPGKLTALAAYIANGLGVGTEAGTEAFALTILIYFSVCGFVFGFLWARLYLPRWFRAADDVQMLVEKVSRLEKQGQADAKALMLINQLLNREAADDPPASEQEVAEAIKASSEPAKSQIFNQAKKTSENQTAEDYDVKIQGVTSILKGLIACDEYVRYHRNHSELSYALYRKAVYGREGSDLQEAENEITKAIEIRDRLRKTGWKYYECHRALCLIEQDPNFKKGMHSDPDLKNRIEADLKMASSQTDKWKKWYESKSKIETWMTKNESDVAKPEQS